MVSYGKLRSAEFVPAAAQFTHGRVNREQRLGSHGAQSNNRFWVDHFNLPHQEGRTSLTLIAFGGAVRGRTALDDIRDINVLAAKAHSLDHVIQQLSGAADEWF